MAKQTRSARSKTPTDGDQKRFRELESELQLARGRLKFATDDIEKKGKELRTLRAQLKSAKLLGPKAAVDADDRFGEAQRLAGIGIWEWDLDSGETWWSPTTYRLWGTSQAAAPPPLAERRIHADDVEIYAGAMKAGMKSGVIDCEWRVVLPDGAVRWLTGTGRLRPTGGRRVMLGVVQDVTDRKATETRLALSLGELQRRTRNMLGVVRSVVARTVRSSLNIEDLAAALDGRLATLARIQGVFARNNVTSVDLEDLIRDELVSVAARDEQLAIGGPAVHLKRGAAESIALVFHELTTNALKYGALAEPAGRLAVCWRIVDTSEGPRLSLDWRESGVRALAIRPARIGFGRELIERSLPYELGAETSLEFGRGGARAVIEVLLTERIAELSDPP